MGYITGIMYGTMVIFVIVAFILLYHYINGYLNGVKDTLVYYMCERMDMIDGESWIIKNIIKRIQNQYHNEYTENMDKLIERVDKTIDVCFSYICTKDITDHYRKGVSVRKAIFLIYILRKNMRKLDDMDRMCEILISRISPIIREIEEPNTKRNKHEDIIDRYFKFFDEELLL